MSLRGFDRMATFEAPGVRRACLFTYLSLLPFHRAVSLTFSGFFFSLHYPVFHIQLLNPVWIFRLE